MTTRLCLLLLSPSPPTPHTHNPALQEFKQLEDAAFRVLEAVERTKAELEAKGEELAAIRADFEEKKKEVGVKARGWCWGCHQGPRAQVVVPRTGEGDGARGREHLTGDALWLGSTPGACMTGICLEEC